MRLPNTQPITTEYLRQNFNATESELGTKYLEKIAGSWDLI